MTTLKRIGILAGGDDCPGLDAAVRAVTKAALSRHLEVEVVDDELSGFRRSRAGVLKRDDESEATKSPSAGQASGGDAIASPGAIERTGRAEYADFADRVVDRLRALRFDAIVCIGGNGTMTGAARLLERGVNCVGIPKTIENDIEGCEQTIGFDTGVATTVEALDRIQPGAMGHQRVVVVEVTGQDAGWLALHAGIASGSDVILLPEVRYEPSRVFEVLCAHARQGKRRSIVCVSEGARPVGQGNAEQCAVSGGIDPLRPGGVAFRLAADIESETGLDARAVVLGHPQRGGQPTAFDRLLATRFGVRAVELMLSGDRGRLAVWRDGLLSDATIQSAAGKRRTVPVTHPLVVAALATGVSFGTSGLDSHLRWCSGVAALSLARDDDLVDALAVTESKRE